jgi:predicted NAD-dependent protein-ADP-ribosyltransferase YbiA (DUF1768 family)
MKKVPQIFSAVQPNIRGKVAQFTVDKNLFQHDADKAINAIANKYDNYLKYTQATKTVEYNFPNYAKRLSERQRPCEVRNLKREDQFRKRDYNIVKDFCDWFMWSQAAYKPPVKK